MKAGSINKKQNLNVKVHVWNEKVKELDDLKEKNKKMLKFIKEIRDNIKQRCPDFSMCEEVELDCPDSTNVSCNYIDWFQSAREILEENCSYEDILKDDTLKSCNNCIFIDCVERNNEDNMCAGWQWKGKKK